MIDEIGNKYGRLTVIDKDYSYIRPSIGKPRLRWVCKCDCGSDKLVYSEGYQLRNGLVTSCGCRKEEGISKKSNEYDLESESYGIGYTTKGEKFLFDKEDYDLIKDYCWSYKEGYLRARDRTRKKNIRMNRLVMNVLDNPDPLLIVVDHINHNTFDNRKENLRIVTQQHNTFNGSLRSNNTSGKTGVSYITNRMKWRASIKVNGKNIHLGMFSDFNDAVKARIDAENKYFGEYANKEEQNYDKQ